MSLADKPAFPFIEGANLEPGMSVRELFAGMIMAGLYANPDPSRLSPDHKSLAICAKFAADALIAELEKDDGNV